MRLVITANDGNRSAAITILRDGDDITLKATGSMSLAQAALETISDLNDGEVTSVVATKKDGTTEVIR